MLIVKDNIITTSSYDSESEVQHEEYKKLLHCYLTLD
jgi:hypothetical protein